MRTCEVDDYIRGARDRSGFISSHVKVAGQAIEHLTGICEIGFKSINVC